MKDKLPTIGLIVVLAGVLLGLIAGWRALDWDLDQMSKLGDALAPVVGVLSLIAVVAALWSVRLQRKALAAQEDQIVDQQRVVAEQMKLQNEALDLQRQALEQQRKELAHQHEALELQLKHQRHAALREAYAPFLAAVGSLQRAIEEYQKQMYVTGFGADRKQREEWQQPANDALAEIDRANRAVQLLDTDGARGTLRWRLTRTVRFEPSVDTTANQKLFADVIFYALLRRYDELKQLNASLGAEFGWAVREEKPEHADFAKKTLDEAKQKAEAADKAITEQYNEWMKREHAKKNREPGK